MPGPYEGSNGPITLREHIAQHLVDHDRRHAEHAEAHERQHLADQRAISVATGNLERRLEALNELRKLVEDQQGHFATIVAMDRLEAKTDRRLNEQRDQIQRLASANERAQGALSVARFLGFGGVMTGLSALVWLIVNGGRP